jgi:hypothetical protein
VARKDIDVVIQTDGRDKGKTFRVLEMSAWDAERWATRAFFAAMNAGVEIDERVARSGMAGIAAAGLGAFGKVPYEKMQPLLDELLTCVTIRFGTGELDHRRMMLEDVEEPGTILQLRAEALNLHINFPMLVAPWRSTTKSSETTTQEQPLSTMSTSPIPSGPRFHPARRAGKSSTK